MSQLEKKWPFIVVVAILTALTTQLVLSAAGVRPISEAGAANLFIYFCCYFTLWRIYSVLGWLLVLWISPATATATGTATGAKASHHG